MGWDQNEGLACKLIQEGRIACGVKGNDYRGFQGFAAALRKFERVGLVEALKEHKESSSAYSYIDTVQWRNPPAVVSGNITTGQRRWLVLRFFADRFEEDDSQLFYPTADHFAGLAGNISRIAQVGEWLAEHGFIMWQPVIGQGGCGHILEKGHEALDHGLEMLNGKPGPTMSHIDQRDQSINVATLNAGSGDLAIGQNATINKQLLAEELVKLLRAIEQGPGDEVEKRTLLSGFKDLLAHPMVTAITGGAFGGMLG